MDLLYHYCSTQAFDSIVRSRKIWLSSLVQSNDYSEGKLVQDSIIRRLSEDSNVESEIVDTIAEAFRITALEYDCLAFCLSEDGDLLSQWRGYANDGTGVAIGFPRSRLIDLASENSHDMQRTFLHRVEYGTATTESATGSIYEEIKELIEDGAFSRGRPKSIQSEKVSNGYRPALATEMFHDYLENAWVSNFYLLKDRGFREEREWRLITTVRRDLVGDNDMPYRVNRGQIIPYYEMPLSSQTPVEIVLGPRHRTPERIVRDYMFFNGFQHARIRRSSVTYR